MRRLLGVAVAPPGPQGTLAAPRGPFRVASGRRHLPSPGEIAGGSGGDFVPPSNATTEAFRPGHKHSMAQALRRLPVDETCRGCCLVFLEGRAWSSGVERTLGCASPRESRCLNSIGVD